MPSLGRSITPTPSPATIFRRRRNGRRFAHGFDYPETLNIGVE